MMNDQRMPKHSFSQSLQFAIRGIFETMKTERNFRLQIGAALMAGIVLVVLRPAPIWWALVIICIGSVLAAELLNTALEKLIDRVHPELDPLIKRSKDSAAGAVLVLSIVSVIVFICLIFQLNR